MSLISDVLSNQTFAHTFRSVQPGQVKALEPSEKLFWASSKGKYMETKRQQNTQDGC